VSGTAAVLVLADGLELRNGTLAALFLELARARIVLPPNITWAVLDPIRAAAKAKIYAKVGVDRWPLRKKPTAAQRRKNQTPPPLVTMQSMAAYELRQCTWLQAAAAAELLSATGVDAVIKLLNVVVAALLKLGPPANAVASPTSPLIRWARRQARYERSARDDPVPSPWQELNKDLNAVPLETPADGPGFSPQVASATLEMPGYPAGGTITAGEMFSYDRASHKGKVPAIGMFVYQLRATPKGQYMGKITAINPHRGTFATDVSFAPTHDMQIVFNEIGAGSTYRLTSFRRPPLQMNRMLRTAGRRPSCHPPRI
jgi:hypothetical protein